MANTPRRAPPMEYLLLLAICLWGGLQRWYGIDRQSLWADELFAVANSYLSHFADLFPALRADSHPPGYLAFMYVTLPWTDYSDAGIRFHAFAAGVLLLPVIYLFGRRYFSPLTGLIAALLLANNFTAIDYSQEARAYSLLMWLSWIHLYHFVAIFIERQYTRGSLYAINLTGILLLYLHYSALVFIGLEVLFAIALCVQQRSTVLVNDGIKAFLLPYVLFLPWLNVMKHHLTDTTYWGTRPSAGKLFEVMEFFVGQDVFSQCLLMGAILWALLLAIRAARSTAAEQRRRACTLFLLWLVMVGPALVFYLKSRVSQPVFMERYFLASLPAALLLAAVPLAKGLEAITHGHWRHGAVLVTFVALSYLQWQINVAAGLYTRITKQPFREAIALVRDDPALKTDRCVVFSTHPYATTHYLRQMKIADYATVVLDRRINAAFIDNYLAQYPADCFYLIEVAAEASIFPRYRNLSATHLPWIHVSKYRVPSQSLPNPPETYIKKF